ncbi:MAG: hypothetical protein IJ300_06920 [Clostridia bacterium]|nr:hypothetical protein [Clostridia bacterium]
MKKLADFDYYVSEYGGTMLDSGSFNQLSLRASALVNAYTFGRAAESSLDDVKAAVCAVAEVIHRHEQNSNIKSENNDGYSVTYCEPENKLDDDIYNTVMTYLQHTKLTRRTRP